MCGIFDWKKSKTIFLECTLDQIMGFLSFYKNFSKETDPPHFYALQDHNQKVKNPKSRISLQRTKKGGTKKKSIKRLDKEAE